jgi:hypothetical protein
MTCINNSKPRHQKPESPYKISLEGYSQKASENETLPNYLALYCAVVTGCGAQKALEIAGLSPENFAAHNRRATIIKGLK